MTDPSIDTDREQPEAAGASVRTSRRSLLGTAAGLTGVALATGAWRPGPGPRVSSPVAGDKAAGALALELDGAGQGSLFSAEGGWPYREVIRSPAGFYEEKHLDVLTYPDLKMQIQFGMSKAVSDWIGGSWTGNYLKKNGAVIQTIKDGIRRRAFSDALIAETTVPACDASLKQAAYLTFRVKPKGTSVVEGSGTIATSKKEATKGSWVPSNFTLAIQDLQTTKVSKIEPFTVKTIIAIDGTGEPSGTKTEFGDLVVTMAETGAKSWSDWYKQFVIDGKNDQEDEKLGVLSFLSSDLKTTLAHIDLFNLGIFKYYDAKQEATDTVKRVTAELYCERMEFHPGPPGSGGGGICAKCVPSQ